MITATVSKRVARLLEWLRKSCGNLGYTTSYHVAPGYSWTTDGFQAHIVIGKLLLPEGNWHAHKVESGANLFAEAEDTPPPFTKCVPTDRPSYEGNYDAKRLIAALSLIEGAAFIEAHAKGPLLIGGQTKDGDHVTAYLMPTTAFARKPYKPEGRDAGL